MLNIDKTSEGSTVTFTLEGRLDTVTAPDFQAELEEVMDDASKLILDFEELDYISSAGLRVLLLAQQNMMKKDGMVLKNVDESIVEIFDVTGFSDILTVE